MELTYSDESKSTIKKKNVKLNVDCRTSNVKRKVESYIKEYEIDAKKFKNDSLNLTIYNINGTKDGLSDTIIQFIRRIVEDLDMNVHVYNDRSEKYDIFVLYEKQIKEVILSLES